MNKIFKILISCLACFVLVLSLGFSGCSCSVKESDKDDQTESIDRDVEYEVYDYTYDSEKSGYDNGVYTITSTCEGKDNAVMTISGLSDEGDITVQTNPVKVTFTKIGTYTLTGDLYGSIEVAIAEEVEDDVEIELSAATITSYTTSPIYVSTENQDDVKISAKKNTTNNVCDYRSVTDDYLDSAIYSVGDLKFKGKGTLNVLSAYNNGIHTKDDLEIKNLTLYVNCVDNALKGNDSVTILSGTLTLLSAEGDGIKTQIHHITLKKQSKKE
ncbi:MAG: carbohydrate-binding domain-containing protein [Clostridia bacterium]|nr:carbohydrate-binding domain-containing protein [Clostridia bacterium]